MIYTGNGSASNLWEFDGRGCFLIGSDSKVYVRIKVDAYINTRDDPFDSEVTEDDKRTRGMALYGDLVLMDNEGSPVSYYCNNPYTEEGWKPVSGGLVPSGSLLGVCFRSFDKLPDCERMENQRAGGAYTFLRRFRDIEEGPDGRDEGTRSPV